MDKKILLGGIILVLLIAGGAYFMFGKASDGDSMMTEIQEMSGNNSGETDNNTQTQMTDNSSTEGQMVDGVRVFTVNGSNFKFEPGVMNVKKGDKVKVVFKNTDGFHDLVIETYNLRTKQIGGGTEDSFEFTADQTGSFEFYCSVGQHRQMGMKGTLVVS